MVGHMIIYMDFFIECAYLNHREHVCDEHIDCPDAKDERRCGMSYRINQTTNLLWYIIKFDSKCNNTI